MHGGTNFSRNIIFVIVGLIAVFFTVVILILLLITSLVRAFQ